VIPITIQSLNTENFIPRKNYAQNRLQSSRLQLPEGTILVLDETNLEPGQLNERGLKNLSALKEIITRQVLSYDFEFYQMEVNTNIPVRCTRESSLELGSFSLLIFCRGLSF